ncbi:MAG TPA: methyltransferase domain-containing protein [Pseudogracilibacillus sp.]|nr:methyltransferase domain-containing protein [Pseudogracilibacillus sp.]
MNKQTNKIKKRYNRISELPGFMDFMIRSSWRKELLRKVEGNILEVGVGTGSNFAYYPLNANVTGIDFSPKMLEQAAKKLAQSKADINLKEMDAQAMDFADNTFDYVVTSCVFCSVPDPIKGLKEIRRVVKPGGTIVMLEHMRSNNGFIGRVLDIINPLTVRLTGANVNRKTIRNIESAGLKVVSQRFLMTSIMRELVITPNK